MFSAAPVWHQPQKEFFMNKYTVIVLKGEQTLTSRMSAEKVESTETSLLNYERKMNFDKELCYFIVKYTFLYIHFELCLCTNCNSVCDIVLQNQPQKDEGHM